MLKVYGKYKKEKFSEYDAMKNNWITDRLVF
jgi:hypothetical protein